MLRIRAASIFCLALAAAGCGGTAARDDDFEARAYGAAYWQFPKSAVDLVVSRSSGRPVACGYARRLDPPAASPGESFIWSNDEMYSGDRLLAIKEAEVIRLCGPAWVAPSRVRGAVSSAPGAGTPAAPGRSPAA